MHPCIEQSNGPVSLSPFPSWPDCIINTSRYDFRKGHVVATVEMPNGEAMVKFASAISAIGNARTTTVRGYTPDEFSKLVS